MGKVIVPLKIHDIQLEEIVIIHSSIKQHMVIFGDIKKIKSFSNIYLEF